MISSRRDSSTLAKNKEIGLGYNNKKCMHAPQGKVWFSCALYQSAYGLPSVPPDSDQVSPGLLPVPTPGEQRLE